MFIIMVVHLSSPAAITSAFAVQITQPFFFLTVDADHRTFHTHDQYQRADDLKLFLSAGIFPGAELFSLFTVAIAQLPEQSLDQSMTRPDLMLLIKQSSQLPRLEAYPIHV